MSYVQFGIWVNLQQKVHWCCENFVIEYKRMAWKEWGYESMKQMWWINHEKKFFMYLDELDYVM